MSTKGSSQGDAPRFPGDRELVELLKKTHAVTPEAGFGEGLREAFLSGFPGQGSEQGAAQGAAQGDIPQPQPNSRSQGAVEPRSAGGEGQAFEPMSAATPSPSGTELDRPQSNEQSPDEIRGDASSMEGAELSAAELTAAEEGHMIRSLAGHLTGHLTGQAQGGESCRPEFREGLRTCFLSGKFPVSASGPAVPELAVPELIGEERALDDSAAGHEGAERVAQEHRSRFRILRGILVAAAAVLLMTVLLPKEPQWSIRLLEGDGLLAVNGFEQLIPVEDFEGNVGALIESGGMQTGLSRVQFMLADRLIVEFAPGSTVDLAGLAERSKNVPWRMRLESGEAYVLKGKGSADRAFLIATPDLEVEVLGTTLGVMCDGQLTCVCVCDGRVDVQPVPGRLTKQASVTEGNSLLVLRHEEKPQGAMPFPAARCPSDDPHDHHVCGLLAFDARASFEH